MLEQKCPLCGLNAKFKYPPYGTSNKCFSCDDCKLFVISPVSEKYLLNAPETWSEKLSEQSKSLPSGAVLLIVTKGDDAKIELNPQQVPEKDWF